MARLLGPGRLLVHGAASPEGSLCVTLRPARGELVRVVVEDRRVDATAGAAIGGLFAPPYRAQGLVDMARVERLADELQAVLAAAPVPVELTDTDLVLQATLPLDDGPLEVELREDEGAPPLPLALGLIEDFAVQVVALPETRVERLVGPAAARRRTSWPWLRLLAIIAMIGAGGYFVGGFFQRALSAIGCAPP